MSRKYFGTDGIRGRVGSEKMSPDFVLKLGWAAGRVLAQSGKKRVLIGKDTRISGYMFESALEAGLIAAGVNVRMLGPIPTPAIAYLTRTLRANAGIVVSASHNPYYDNGIKFLNADGGKLSDEMELAIEAQLDQPMITVESDQLGRAKRVVDAQGRYIEFCKSTFPNHLQLDDLKIVVDCAHGAGYQTAPRVFTELGAEVVMIGNQPDGININQDCGATAPQALAKAVKTHSANLGVALDGDGDRLIVVDEHGNILDGDEILYIIANHLDQHGELNGGVVGTVMSNLGLELALKEKNIDFARAAVGDRYVMQDMVSNNWWLGGEPSGHIICRYAALAGDGIVAALQVIAAMLSAQKPLSECAQGMNKLPQVMINVPLKQKVDIANHSGVQTAVKAAEGTLGEGGRVLLRPSGTEPLVRVMVEGVNGNQVQSVCQQLADDVAELI